MEPRMTILTLGVSDLEKARGFYLDGLGWKEASNSSEEISFIEMNGFILALYHHDALATDATVPEDRSQFRGFALAYNVVGEREPPELRTVFGHGRIRGQCIMVVEGEDEAIHLDEGNLFTAVARFFPAKTVEVEAARLFEIRHAQGQNCHSRFHKSS